MKKLNEIEEFHPDRMASRILGMGDVLSIIEQAENAFDLEEAEKLEKKLRKNKELDLNDYLAQLKTSKKDGFIFINTKNDTRNEQIQYKCR